MAQNISNLDIGSKVKFGTFRGEPITWLVAGKNHYRQPENSVTLLSEKILRRMMFDGAETLNQTTQVGNCAYSLSNIRQWMNSDADAGNWYTPQHSDDFPPSQDRAWTKQGGSYDTLAGFLNEWSEGDKHALLTTEVISVLSGASITLSDKVFLLSTNEVGIGSGGSSTEDGNKLPLFDSWSHLWAKLTQKAIDEYVGTDILTLEKTYEWWLRTPTGINVYCAPTAGSAGYGLNAFMQMGFRPAVNVTSTLKVTDVLDENGNFSAIPNVPPSMPPSITVPPNIKTGTFITITWEAASDADGNLIGYDLERSANIGLWEAVYRGNALSYTDYIEYDWTQVEYRVKAHDSSGAESGYTTTPILDVTYQPESTLTFTLKPISMSTMATKCAVRAAGGFPLGSTLTVKVSNNGADNPPTWEDISDKLGEAYLFANSTKNAASWAFGMEVTLARGTAAGDVYLDYISLNYE